MNTPERNIHLLERQIKDLITQAELILSGNNSASQIETLSKYSEELKLFINTRIENKSLQFRAQNIEKINFKRNELKLWHYLTFSFWLVYLIQYMAIQRSTEEIARVKTDWNNLLFELQGNSFDTASH